MGPARTNNVCPCNVIIINMKVIWMYDFIDSPSTEIFAINESWGTGSRVFGVFHASGLGGCTRSTKLHRTGSISLYLSIQRAAEGGEEDGRGREEHERNERA